MKQSTKNLIKNGTIVVSVFTVIIAIVLSNITISKTEDAVNTRMTKYADSISMQMKSDSLYYANKLHYLDSEAFAYKHIADSLSTAIAVNQKTNKQYVRTIYKDSIKEVYVENTELALQYEQTIKRLEDSLAIDKKIVVHDTVVIDGTQTEQSVVQTTQLYDTVYTEKHTTENVSATDPRFTLFVEGNVDIMDDVEINGIAGGKVRLLGPIYGKAAVKYDGDIGGELGVGAELRF